MPPNKILKLSHVSIIGRPVFKTATSVIHKLFQMNVYITYKDATQNERRYNIKELMFLKELTLINQINQKNLLFVIIGILKILVLNLNHMFVINVMMYQ